MRRHHFNEVRSDYWNHQNCFPLSDPQIMSTYDGSLTLQLAESISKTLDVPIQQVTIDAGADGVLFHLFSYINKLNIPMYIPSPSYTGYERLCNQLSLPFETYRALHDQDIHSLIQKSRSQEMALVVCHPDNPTGQVDTSLIKKLADFSGHLIIDEAYIEMTPKSSLLPLLKQRKKRTAIVRTFSKAFGAPNLRVGYLLGSRDVSKTIRRLQNPFPVSCLSIAHALKLWSHREEIIHKSQEHIEECRHLREKLCQLDFNCSPTETHFFSITDHPKIEMKDLHRLLENFGVKTQLFRRPTSLVRLTSGAPSENEYIIQKISQILDFTTYGGQHEQSP
jgi:histidinol-phosphate/aromatic aminotransferase/cobyric acid decarboxylase-like protein